MQTEKHGGPGHALHAGLVAVALGLALLFGLTSVAAAASPPMAHWVDPLPVPPVATQTFNPYYSLWADYYEINMTASQHLFNSGLPGPATVWTYGQPGKDPVLLGPTVIARTGRPVVIKWINDLPTDPSDFPLKDAIDSTLAGSDVPTGAAIPHLHGGIPQRASMALPISGGRPTARRVGTSSPRRSPISTTSRLRCSGITTTRWELPG
jgi:FtsP/CotA-like multicopper oxidase with cupredoxin domain